MEDPAEVYAREHRLNAVNKKTFFNHADLGYIHGRLKARRGAPAPPAATGRQRRVAGGAKPVPKPVSQDPPLEFSGKIVDGFKIDYLVNGEEILLRKAYRPAAADRDKFGYKWLPIVALDDLRELVKEQNERALLFKCGKKLYNHIAYNVATQMAPNPDGTPRVIYGKTGLDRKFVEFVMESCIVRNDQAATKPEEMPPPVAIVTLCALLHCQADLIDLGANRDPRYRYVLVYIDHYSRHVWLRPLATKEPLQVAREIYWIWMDTQRPARLQSDNGTEFCAAVMEKLCDLMGVEFVHGSVGHPQSQGAVERANQTIKKTISARLLVMPTGASWAAHVLDVQKAVNNMPHEAHGGKMTPSQVLYGQPEAASLLPKPDQLAELLNFASSADIHERHATAVGEGAAAPSGGRPTKAPAAGRKRNAAEAELAELSDEEAELSGDEEAWEAAAAAVAAGPARPRSGRAAAAGLQVALAAVFTNEEELGEAAPSRALPQRAAAVSSPAGKRRRLTGAMQAQAAQQAEQAKQQTAAEAAAAEQAAAVAAAQQAAAEAAAAEQAAAAAQQAAAAQAQAAEQVAAGPSTAAAPVRRSGRRAPAAAQQAADDEAVAADILQGMATAGAAAAEVQPLMVDAEVAQEEEAATSAAAVLDALPPHLRKVREAANAAHVKERQRIRNARKGKGKGPVQPFEVGTDVVAKPSKKGKVGNPTGPARIAARVIAKSKPFGQLKYRLRTNTGVLVDTYFHGQLRKAVPGRPDAPRFEGVAAQGVPLTTERQARGGAVGCACRAKGGVCGKACPCKKGGNPCGRHCGCKFGKGGNCGNCK